MSLAFREMPSIACSGQVRAVGALSGSRPQEAVLASGGFPAKSRPLAGNASRLAFQLFQFKKQEIFQ